MPPPDEFRLSLSTNLVRVGWRPPSSIQSLEFIAQLSYFRSEASP